MSDAVRNEINRYLCNIATPTIYQGSVSSYVPVENMTRLLRKFSNYFFALYPVYSREKWPRFSTSTTQKNDKFRTENFAPRSAPTTIFKLNVTSNGRRINDRTRKICSRVSSLFFFCFKRSRRRNRHQI